MTRLLAQDEFNQDLLAFIRSSPTAFHATTQIAQRLQQAGFTRLFEGDSCKLESGKRYFVTRNDSSIIAFVYGTEPLLDNGIRMVGAHTDSPCLKVKPQPELNRRGYFQLGVEVYGGALLAPWFDRDLSLAGRVSYRDGSHTIRSVLVNFVDPVATIPSLAIHLDREVNRDRSINAQKDVVPLLLQLNENGAQTPDFRALLLAHIQREYPQLDAAQVLDYEISLYDTRAPAL